MCVSPATLNLRAARQLEWECVHSDEEDELPSAGTSLGLPMGYISDSEDAQEVSTCGVAQEPLLRSRNNIHQSTAEIDRQMMQLQLVCTKVTFYSLRRQHNRGFLFAVRDTAEGRHLSCSRAAHPKPRAVGAV